MIKDGVWMTTNELAGLPGLPKTARGVLRRALRESWPSRRRKRGKGCEYYLPRLPACNRKPKEQLGILRRLEALERAVFGGAR